MKRLGMNIQLVLNHFYTSYDDMHFDCSSVCMSFPIIIYEHVGHFRCVKEKWYTAVHLVTS